MADYPNGANDWLDRLERDSWNLELLISGFSIFLLMEVQEVLSQLPSDLFFHTNFSDQLYGIFMPFLGLVRTASRVLVVMLITHLLIRAFWIGAVGLRSVQKKIEFNKLNFSDFFTRKLRERVRSLDDMIFRLDDIASVFFSFTFLVVFMLVSLGLAFSFLVLVKYGFDQVIVLFGDPLREILPKILDGVILIYLLAGIFYLIDTLTLGFFKRYQWLSRLFYPVYRFFGVITLAGIYRSIYYTLISRFSKGRIRLVLVSFLVLTIVIPLADVDYYIFFPDNNTPQNWQGTYYDDQRPEQAKIHAASIPSATVSSRFMPVFIRYDVKHNDQVMEHCEGYRPSKKPGLTTGIRLREGNLEISSPELEEEDPERLLKCLTNYYSIYINDSLMTDLRFWFERRPENKERGIRTVLDTKGLPSGAHQLLINYRVIGEEGKVTEEEWASIPFWLEE